MARRAQRAAADALLAESLAALRGFRARVELTGNELRKAALDNLRTEMLRSATVARVAALSAYTGSEDTSP